MISACSILYLRWTLQIYGPVLRGWVTRFGGVDDAANIFAQNGNFNLGAYKTLENQWARDLAAGRSVQVQITPRYTGNSLRPDGLTVITTTEGESVQSIFRNWPGGR